MKTWILVWIITFQPTGPNEDFTFEYHRESDLTFERCVQLLAQKDVDLPETENYAGHSIYCEDKAPTKVLLPMLREDI